MMGKKKGMLFRIEEALTDAKIPLMEQEEIRKRLLADPSLINEVSDNNLVSMCSMLRVHWHAACNKLDQSIQKIKNGGGLI